MNDKAAQQQHAAQQAFMQAMFALEAQYVDVLVRCGCRKITLYRM